MLQTSLSLLGFKKEKSPLCSLLSSCTDLLDSLWFHENFYNWTNGQTMKWCNIIRLLLCRLCKKYLSIKIFVNFTWNFFSLIPSNYRFLHSYSYNKKGRLKNLNIHDESFISLNEFATLDQLNFYLVWLWYKQIIFNSSIFFSWTKGKEVTRFFLKAASSFHPGLTGCYSFSIQPLTIITDVIQH